MDTRLGYIGGLVAFIMPFCPVNSWIKYSLGTIGVICFAIAWFLNGRISLKNKKELKNKPENASPIEKTKLQEEAVRILKALTDHERLTSEDLLNLISIPSAEANYWLEELEKQKFIHCAMFPNLIVYSLDQKGYEYLKNNNLIGNELPNNRIHTDGK